MTSYLILSSWTISDEILGSLNMERRRLLIWFRAIQEPITSNWVLLHFARRATRPVDGCRLRSSPSCSSALVGSFVVWSLGASWYQAEQMGCSYSASFATGKPGRSPVIISGQLLLLEEAFRLSRRALYRRLCHLLDLAHSRNVWRLMRGRGWARSSCD